jgi:hypothetical protein
LKRQKIFLFDAAGAAVSVLLLMCLYSFEKYFGMPRIVLQIFISIALVLFILSTTIYFINPLNWKFLLIFIALLNLAYCLFTIYFVFQSVQTITLFGKIYFICEVLAILMLSIFEIKLVKSTK